jgi:NAD(P)-dependent dehydrogenase (short-subunit alcohol dehydrogenase family)
MKRLANKVAVITGAASGIGLAMARRAAAERMKVVLADIEQAALQTAANALAGDGATVLAVVTDVSSGSSVESLRDQALEAFGAVHLVHNNAGVAVGGPVWAVSEPDWRWILGVNLWGVIHGIRAFVPMLVDQGEGHVVNTASLAGLTSPGLMGPYNVTKHAVVTLSETLARDLELVASKVGVSVVCPGFVQTSISESDRNRPDWAPAAPRDERSAEARRFSSALLADGMPAADVARQVFDAVRANRFYVLTHPHLNSSVETRLQDIIQGRRPSASPIV